MKPIPRRRWVVGIAIVLVVIPLAGQHFQARFAALGRSAQLRTRMFPHYNHFMMWEHPSEANAVISDFLTQSGMVD